MRTIKNALANLVQTAILNFKMALNTHILGVKEFNENNKKCIG